MARLKILWENLNRGRALPCPGLWRGEYGSRNTHVKLKLNRAGLWEAFLILHVKQGASGFREEPVQVGGYFKLDQGKRLLERLVWYMRGGD